MSCARGSARPSSTGAWRLSGRYVYMLDLGLVASLRTLFGNASVVEFGAGTGCYADALIRSGVQVAAFDGAPGISDVTEGLVRHADLTGNVTAIGQADWVLSLEVGEHIPPYVEHMFLHNIVSHASVGIVLSWSNGAGNGHVNPRPSEYVRRKMTELGWYSHEPDTRMLRSAVATVPWLRLNLQVYRFDPQAAAQEHERLRSQLSLERMQGVEVGEPRSVNCTYQFKMHGSYNDGRRCGTCCGAPDDLSTPMCVGSTWDGVLYNVSREEVEQRCSRDDSCAGFYVSTGQMLTRWLLKSGLRATQIVGSTFRPVHQWRLGGFIASTNLTGWDGFAKHCRAAGVVTSAI